MRYMLKFNFLPILFSATFTVLAAFSSAHAASRSTHSTVRSAQVDTKSLCSNESQKRLAKLELRGESRFSEFKFNPESTLSSNVEFTDLGETGHRRHHRKVQQKPATPEYGQFLIMKAQGKEKMGWRNLIVRCGVNKGKLATFTYEILSLADAPGLATPLATTKLPSKIETITTPHPALEANSGANSPQPASTSP
jgi:hypothetical protein